MESKLVASRPIDLRVVDTSDDDLESILRLRKTVDSRAKRIGFLKGLYYISVADSSYTEEEKSLVEGTACALGITAADLGAIAEEVDREPEAAVWSLSSIGDKKFRQQLFEEMAALTYLKGYQLASEDEAMMSAANALGIAPSKAEKTMDDLYMRTQGFDTHKKSTAAKAALGIGAIAAGATVCAVTAGVAAPAIGAAIGGLQGLHGIAAVNAGLAILGGGTLAAGGGGVAAGTAAIIAAGAVAGGGVAAVGVSVKENISAAHDIKTLQAAIKKQQRDDMTTQEIIDNLVQAIELEKARLAQLEELHASKRDIASIELQIANLQSQKATVELNEKA